MGGRGVWVVLVCFVCGVLGFFIFSFWGFLFLLLFITATDYLIPKEEACREENEEK